MSSEETELIEALEPYRLKSHLVPNTIYYVPDFISAAEEDTLIGHVLAAPKPKWTYLTNRSLQNWGGLPHPKGMVAEELPEWLKKYTAKLGSLRLFAGGDTEPNHILMNRYEPGQGIMAHEDGPLFYPTVTTINAGSHTVLNFYKKPAEAGDSSRLYAFSLLLWPRSLLVLRHDAYTSYLHEIQELTSDLISREDSKEKFANWDCIPGEALQSYRNDDDGGWVIPRDTRYSFTIRQVPKVLKATTLHKLLFSK